MSIYPEIIAETPFGKLKVWATDSNHVGVSTRNHYESGEVKDAADSVTINRVEYRLRVDFHPVAYFEANGKRPAEEQAEGWATDLFHGVYLSREDYQDASYAATRKARKVLTEWFGTFITSDHGQELLKTGKTAHVREATRRLEQQIGEKRAELASLESELAALE